MFVCVCVGGGVIETSQIGRVVGVGRSGGGGGGGTSDPRFFEKHIFLLNMIEFGQKLSCHFQYSK